MINKKDLIKDLPIIEDPAIYNAVDLALWLIVDKHSKINYSINCACAKHNAKPKYKVKEIVLAALPPGFGKKRSSNAYKGFTGDRDGSKYQALKVQDAQNLKHMKDILS